MSAREDQSFEESLAGFGARKTYAATSYEDAVERVRAALINATSGNPTEFSPFGASATTPTRGPVDLWHQHRGPRAGKIVAEEARDDAATLAPCHVVQQVGEGTRRVYHTSLPKVPGEAGLAPEDSAPADD